MVGMGLHHKICHTLGGTFDLPHADVHAIVLPYVAEFNASAAPGAMARVAMALGGLAASDAGRCLYDLRRKTCPKQSLASLGMAQSDIRPAAELASAGSSDRKSVVEGKSVSVRVDLGVGRSINKKTNIKKT